MGKTLVIGIVLVALAAIGCGKKGPSSAAHEGPLVAMVAIDIPGASAESVDADMYRLFLLELPVIPSFRTFTCISRQGAFEGYVEAEASTDFIEFQDRLYSALPTAKLPDGAGKPVVRFVREWHSNGYAKGRAKSCR